MAVATAAALVGTGISAYQAIKAGKDRKASKNAMDNYDRQELVNPYEKLKLSTYGTDIRREESARTVASLTDIAKGMGARGAWGLIPKIQGNANKVEGDIATDYVDKFEKREYAIAAAEEKINDWKVGRDNTNIAALSSQYNAANQDLNKGLWGMASGLMTYATAQEDSGDRDGGKPKKPPKKN